MSPVKPAPVVGDRAGPVGDGGGPVAAASAVKTHSLMQVSTFNLDTFLRAQQEIDILKPITSSL